jgi:hypothetical protein
MGFNSAFKGSNVNLTETETSVSLKLSMFYKKILLSCTFMLVPDDGFTKYPKHIARLEQ